MESATRMSNGVLGIWERVRFAGYGLAAGLFLGLILGWMFHGFVGALVRIVLILIILIPFVAAVIFWFKVQNRNRAETDGIQEAEWREPTDYRQR